MESVADFSGIGLADKNYWATKLTLANMHTHPPSQHTFLASTSHSPSQQQLQTSLNKKTNPTHNAKMGRGAFGSIHTHKKNITQTKDFLRKVTY
jgi:hypothetical protein